jgi:hypothetical protein
VDVLACVHAAHRLVVDVRHGAAQAQQLVADRRPPLDRPVVSHQQQLGLEREHAVEGVDEREGLAVAVAADRHQVREMSEERAEEVAREADAVVGKPHDHRVPGLAARSRQQLEAHASELECVAILEGDRRLGSRLGGHLAAEVLAHVGVGSGDGLREGEAAAAGPEGGDAGVVLLVGRVVLLAHDLGRGLSQQVHAAHVVHVALGEEDEADRAGVHRVVVALVDRRLEAHPGVDDHATLGRHHQVAVREALRDVDEVVDAPGLGLGCGLDREAVRARAMERGGGHGGRIRRAEPPRKPERGGGGVAFE